MFEPPPWAGHPTVARVICHMQDFGGGRSIHKGGGVKQTPNRPGSFMLVWMRLPFISWCWGWTALGFNWARKKWRCGPHFHSEEFARAFCNSSLCLFAIRPACQTLTDTGLSKFLIAYPSREMMPRNDWIQPVALYKLKPVATKCLDSRYVSRRYPDTCRWGPLQKDSADPWRSLILYKIHIEVTEFKRDPIKFWKTFNSSYV